MNLAGLHAGLQRSCLLIQRRLTSFNDFQQPFSDL